MAATLTNKLKSSNKSNTSGFSLLELMCVIGIVSILASMSMTKIDIYVCKAKQAEAKLNLKSIHALQVSYYDDNQQYYVGQTSPLGSCSLFDFMCIFGNAVLGYSALDESQRLTIADYTNEKSCNLSNPLGFKIADCRKTRYRYQVGRDVTGESPRNNFLATAIEGVWNGKRRICEDCIAGQMKDYWGVDATGVVKGVDLLSQANGMHYTTCPFSVGPPGC